MRISFLTRGIVQHDVRSTLMQILLVCSADIGIAMNCHAILHSELLEHCCFLKSNASVPSAARSAKASQRSFPL
jgi:hypothetical protein